MHRLCAELLRLARPASSDGALAISPPPTHAELAARVGSRREAVTRALRQLEQDELLGRRRGAIVLLRPDILGRNVSDACEGWWRRPDRRKSCRTRHLGRLSLSTRQRHVGSRQRPGHRVQNRVAFTGFDGAIFTNAPNTGVIFVALEPFGERAAQGLTAARIRGDVQQALSVYM